MTRFPLRPQTKQRRPPTLRQNGHLAMVKVFVGINSSFGRAAIPRKVGVLALDERAELDPPVEAPSATLARRSFSGG